MKRHSRVFLVISMFALAAMISGCGNPLEGGSSPSGSVIRVTDTTITGNQDLYFCEGESGVTYQTVNVILRNDSTPNSPTATNSFVTINRYQITYAVLNMSATLPTITGSGFTFGIDPNGTGTLTVEFAPEPVLEYIRSNYNQVGNGQAMSVRADITIYGQDTFQVNVQAVASATFTIDDLDPCGDGVDSDSDIVVPDQETSGQ